MNSLQRTLDFLMGKPVDRVPFHPIFMQFTARFAGVKYRDFILDPETKVAANIACARAFDYDWVNVMSDPYCEAEAWGLKVDYPEDSLPIPKELVINDIADIETLQVPGLNASRVQGRVREIELFKEKVGQEQFICGWVEGPLAEYCDIRDLTSAMMDFYLYPEEMKKGLDLITEFALKFITVQVEAGAHCIGIGDAVCSQIAPDLYREFVFEREKQMIDHIHSLGALAKLHICGNTSGILPDMIKTGADIVDVDHLVGDMSEYAKLLGAQQVLSGNSDPVSVILNGSDEELQTSVDGCHAHGNGRCIVSAGCEIPAATSHERIKLYRDRAKLLR
jgi:MtaA/CmuA family methyltransferase